MKATTQTLLVIILGLSLAACSNSSSFEAHQIYTAPAKVEADLGLIVMGLSTEEADQLLSENPYAQRKNIGNGFAYEFRGLSKSQILEVSPSAKIEHNKFLKHQNENTYKKVSKNTLTRLMADASEEFSPENCINNAILRVPEVGVRTSNAKGILSAGETIEVISNKTTADPGLIAWYFVSPMGSNQGSGLIEGNSLSFKPDMPGSYSIALFYKRRGQCNSRVLSLPVTLNVPFNADVTAANISSLERLENRNFKQLSLTKADKARALLKNKPAKKLIVAVLDSGVNYNHPALKEHMWINKGEIAGDGIDNDRNGFVDDVVGYDFANNDSMPMDDAGHGTHVAGLVAGEFMGPGFGLLEIMAIKGGNAQGIDTGSLVAAILYCVDNGANIINMSFGGSEPSETTKAAIVRAQEKNVLIVAAAGNSRINNDKEPQYPASYDLDNILTIAASTGTGSLTNYSNYGATSVDIATVGGHVDFFERSANLLHSAYLVNPQNVLTQPMSGTSMASPVAAGIAGLVMTQRPDLTPAETIEVLMKTGDKADLLRDRLRSEAVINAEAALLAI